MGLLGTGVGGIEPRVIRVGDTSQTLSCVGCEQQVGDFDAIDARFTVPARCERAGYARQSLRKLVRRCGEKAGKPGFGEKRSCVRAALPVRVAAIRENGAKPTFGIM